MDARDTDEHSQQQPDVYEIRVAGHLDARWSAWFDGLSLSRETDGTTTIHGPIADQSALHGVLQRVRDLGIELIAVTRLNPGSND